MKEYSEDFKEGSAEDEEVLFQKSPVAKKAAKDKPKEKKRGEMHSLTKAERILRETIRYRLTSQRYTYSDFHTDIFNSKVTEFTAEELIGMFSNEPFFLSEDHLKMVIFGLFERSDLEPEEKI
jgi:hypothetical protein